MKYLLKKVKVKVELFITDVFIPMWVKLLNYIRKIFMLFTFICIVAGVVYVAYHLFICYDSFKVITACVFLFTMVSVNHALQG